MTSKPAAKEEEVGKGWEPPKPHRPPAVATIWLDYHSGAGVDEQRRPIEPIITGSRKKPKLVDLLNTARHQHVERIVLCGELPSTKDTVEKFLLGPSEEFSKYAPDWQQGSSIHANPPAFTGRYTHTPTGHKVVVRTTEEWWRGQQLTPEQARWSTQALTKIIGEVIKKPDWPLDVSAAGTGINIWKLLRGKSYLMERCDPVLGRIIQDSEPQHRIEHMVEGPARCDCGDCWPLLPAGHIADRFVYADGRFMFHGVINRDLGAAPLKLLNQADAQTLWETDPFWPARYQIRYTVPDRWDHMGLFPTRRPVNTRSWHYPNRPGATHTTWADAVEMRIAARVGWQLEILEAIKLSKVDPMSNYANNITRMVELTEQTYADNSRAIDTITGAIKHMYRVTIGTFARAEALTTRVTKELDDVPATAVSHRVLRDIDTDEVNGYEYQLRDVAGDKDSWHPEIAARIWAMARARVLSNTSTLTAAPTAGALTVSSDELIGIQGDAVYTTTVQPWTLPTAAGGADDGKNGRLRLKGIVEGPLAVPDTKDERQELSKLAELTGIPEDLLVSVDEGGE